MKRKITMQQGKVENNNEVMKKEIDDLQLYLNVNKLKIRNLDGKPFTEESMVEFITKFQQFAEENNYHIVGKVEISNKEFKKMLFSKQRVPSDERTIEIMNKYMFKTTDMEDIDVYELDLLKKVDDYLKSDNEYQKMRKGFDLSNDILTEKDFNSLKKFVNDNYHVGHFELNSTIAQLSLFQD